MYSITTVPTCRIAFHEIRASTLPKVWRSFLSNIGCGDMTDPLFPQLVNQHLFEEIVKSEYEVCTSEQRSARRVLSKDEENIIRYACGYVTMRLLCKFKRTEGNKAASFVECLSHMAIEGPEESLLKYTQEWIKKIDRGGLFEVSDGCYHLFAAIEIALGDKLKVHLQSSTTQHTLAKSSLIQSVSCDEDVQFYWAMQSVDIDNNEHSAELLHHIIELWVTIRGFSIAASWLEDYKRVMNTSTLKSTGLRKGLKKKACNSEDN